MCRRGRNEEWIWELIHLLADWLTEWRTSFVTADWLTDAGTDWIMNKVANCLADLCFIEVLCDASSIWSLVLRYFQEINKALASGNICLVRWYRLLSFSLLFYAEQTNSRTKVSSYMHRKNSYVHETEMWLKDMTEIWITVHYNDAVILLNVF